MSQNVTLSVTISAAQSRRTGIDALASGSTITEAAEKASVARETVESAKTKPTHRYHPKRPVFEARLPYIWSGWIPTRRASEGRCKCLRRMVKPSLARRVGMGLRATEGLPGVNFGKLGFACYHILRPVRSVALAQCRFTAIRVPGGCALEAVFAFS